MYQYERHVRLLCQTGEPVTLPIEADNVFTHCLDCGKEHKVDLVELAGSGDFDLYGSAVCCDVCTKKRQERRENKKASGLPIPQRRRAPARFFISKHFPVCEVEHVASVALPLLKGTRSTDATICH